MATSGGGSRQKEVQLALRVSQTLMEAIDREVERLRSERPGAKLNRSDAVREILHQVLLSDPKIAEESSRRRQARRRADRGGR